MTREVCGMCWCPYGDDGRCACPVEEVFSKPVAWGIANTRPTEKNPLMQVMLYEPLPSHLVIPLYTHPHKQLSDEEIEKVISTRKFHNWTLGEFARAIIKEITE